MRLSLAGAVASCAAVWACSDAPTEQTREESARCRAKTTVDIDLSGFEAYASERAAPPDPSPSAPDTVYGELAYLAPARSYDALVWVPEDADLDVEVVLDVGEGLLGDTSRVSAVGLVDGIQVKLVSAAPLQQLDSDEAQRHVSSTITTNRATRMRMRVAASDLAGSAHSLALLFTLDGRATPLMAFSATVFHEGASAVLPKGRDDTALFTLRPRTELTPFAVSGDLSLGPQTERTTLAPLLVDGALPVGLVLQGPDGDIADCPDLAVPYSVVALVDGEQVPFADVGPLLRAYIPGDSQAFLETALEGLPDDGELHTLSILQLTGDGAPALLHSGRLPPWLASPKVRGLLRWQ